MMMQSANEFDSTNVFLFFIRWWKHLAIICLLAAIGAVIFSSPWFITPKFESAVTMFPSSSSSLSRAVLGGPLATRQDFLQYGEVEDAERLLQVLGSAAVRDRVVARFDLMNHYGISPDGKYRYTQLHKEYRSNISFRRTQFGAIEIAVRDKDPELAAAMANEIAALVDTVQNDIRRDRAQQAYQVAKSQYEEMQLQVQLVEDSLRKIMYAGVVDLEGQSGMLTRQLAIDLSAQNASGVRAIEERLKLLGQHGGSYVFLTNYLENISENMATIQRRYQEARADLENFLSFTFIIDPAFASERKVYPVRWLIVFLVTFGAGLMGVMSLVVYETLVNKGILKD